MNFDKGKKAKISIWAGILTQPPNCHVEYDRYISISKIRQQISKFSKSAKYTHPKGQLPAMQYACTSSTTMVPDVFVVVVIVPSLKYSLDFCLVLNIYILFLYKIILNLSAKIYLFTILCSVGFLYWLNC